MTLVYLVTAVVILITLAVGSIKQGKKSWVAKRGMVGNKTLEEEHD